MSSTPVQRWRIDSQQHTPVQSRCEMHLVKENIAKGDPLFATWRRPTPFTGVVAPYYTWTHSNVYKDSSGFPSPFSARQTPRPGTYIAISTTIYFERCINVVWFNWIIQFQLDWINRETTTKAKKDRTIEKSHLEAWARRLLLIISGSILLFITSRVCWRAPKVFEQVGGGLEIETYTWAGTTHISTFQALVCIFF